MQRNNIMLGIFFALTAVILGAMNAHYLKQFFTPELTASFDTGVRYQMYHALALLITGVVPFKNSVFVKRLFFLFALGIILFSWSIFVLCAFKSNGIIGLTGLGILTPIGGLVLIISWISFFIGVYRKK